MESINWGVVIQLFALACGGVGVYVAIRSDLDLMHERHGVMKERVDKIEKKVEKLADNGYCHHRASDI